NNCKMWAIGVGEIVHAYDGPQIESIISYVNCPRCKLRSPDEEGRVPSDQRGRDKKRLMDLLSWRFDLTIFGGEGTPYYFQRCTHLQQGTVEEQEHFKKEILYRLDKLKPWIEDKVTSDMDELNRCADYVDPDRFSFFAHELA